MGDEEKWNRADMTKIKIGIRGKYLNEHNYQDAKKQY